MTAHQMGPWIALICAGIFTFTFVKIMEPPKKLRIDIPLNKQTIDLFMLSACFLFAMTLVVSGLFRGMTFYF